jgi:acyl-coenzyme A synthetase/AMP-(fatty) acid ligase
MNLFSMVFTSGSSGKPKGVLLHHRGTVNFFTWYVKLTQLTPEDRVSHLATVSPAGASLWLLVCLSSWLAWCR